MNNLNRLPFLGAPLAAVSVPFVPTDLANLFAWYKSGAGVTLNGSNVSQWDDQSANAYHGTQGTAANQPAYNVADSDFNGLDSLTFDGTNDRLNIHAAVGFFNGTDKAFTLFVAIKPVLANQYPGIIGSNETTLGNAQVVFRHRVNNVNTYEHYKRDDSGASSDLLGGTSTANKQLICFQSYGTTAEIFVNGSSVAAAAWDLGVTTSDLCMMGCTPTGASSGTNFLSGKIAEIIIYDRSLSSTERDQVTAYLNNKFSVY